MFVLQRQSIRRKPAAAGCSTSTGPGEEDDDYDSDNQKGRSSPGS